MIMKKIILRMKIITMIVAIMILISTLMNQNALICYTFAGPSNILLPSLLVDISSFKVWMIFSYSPFCKFHSDSISVTNNLLQ